jgi:potassium/hydrogen antiporter
MAHDAQLTFAGGAVAAAGVAAVGLATRLRLLARPIVSTVATVRPGFSRSERALLAWVMLSGAVPVTLATFAVIQGVPQGIEHLNIALIAVLVSAGLQGPTVHSLAARIWTGEREHQHALRRSPTAELEVS